MHASASSSHARASVNRPRARATVAASAERRRLVVRVADGPFRRDRLTERLLRLGQLVEPQLRLAERLQRDRLAGLVFLLAEQRRGPFRALGRDRRVADPQLEIGEHERRMALLERGLGVDRQAQGPLRGGPREVVLAGLPLVRRQVGQGAQLARLVADLHEDLERLRIEGEGALQVAELSPDQREPVQDDADAASRAGRLEVLERPLMRVERFLQAADAAQRRAEVVARDRFAAGRLRDRQRFLEQLDGAARFADARARLGELRQRAGARRRVAGALQPRQPALDDRDHLRRAVLEQQEVGLRRARAVGLAEPPGVEREARHLAEGVDQLRVLGRVMTAALAHPS